MELIVYYDENFGNSWVPREVSKQIKCHLKNDKHFIVKNAESLKKWLEKSIDSQTCCNSIVVFSQDVIPENLTGRSLPNCLICSFLYNGGTIIWLGDIPFFYEGCNPSETAALQQTWKKSMKDEEWIKYWDTRKVDGAPKYNIDKEGRYLKTKGRQGCFCALGVNPVWFEHTNSVCITSKGKDFGLTTSWYSHRPILIRGLNFQKNEKITVLAKSKPRFLISAEKTMLDEERQKNLPKLIGLDIIAGALPSLVSLVSSAVAILVLFPHLEPIVVSVLAILASSVICGNVLFWTIRTRSILASAWFKNFNKKYPRSGFVRIWDFGPERLTDDLLRDLYKVIDKRNQGSD